jgi:hypothetical protein
VVSAEIGIEIEIVGGAYDTDFDTHQGVDGRGDRRAALDAGRPLVLG